MKTLFWKKRIDAFMGILFFVLLFGTVFPCTASILEEFQGYTVTMYYPSTFTAGSSWSLLVQPTATDTSFSSGGLKIQFCQNGVYQTLHTYSYGALSKGSSSMAGFTMSLPSGSGEIFVNTFFVLGSDTVAQTEVFVVDATTTPVDLIHQDEFLGQTPSNFYKIPTDQDAMTLTPTYEAPLSNGSDLSLSITHDGFSTVQALIEDTEPGEGNLMTVSVQGEVSVQPSPGASYIYIPCINLAFYAKDSDGDFRFIGSTRTAEDGSYKSSFSNVIANRTDAQDRKVTDIYFTMTFQDALSDANKMTGLPPILWTWA